MASGKEAGKAVLTLRGLTGATQAELGEKLGSSQGRVSEWEGGNSVPSPEMLLKLAALAYDVDPSLSIFFLRQTGISPEVFISAADSYLQHGEADVTLLLSRAELVLRERLA